MPGLKSLISAWRSVTWNPSWAEKKFHMICWSPPSPGVPMW